MIRRVFMQLVRFYQRWISPALPNTCRFIPSCSQYALESLRILPLYIALPRIIWRVLRCNPFCKGGYDPVIKAEAGNTQKEMER